jgi:glycine cleavage system H protein
MKQYTKSHEWIEVEGRYAIVGITHYAQKELGEIVYAQLPKVGQSVQAGKEVCVLESTKAAADVYSPVSGKVIAINESVADRPQIINDAPETTAWLFRLEMSDPKEVSALLSKADYEKLIK